MNENTCEQELQSQSMTIIGKSQELVIFSDKENEEANNILKLVMGLKKGIKAYWKDSIDKAHQAHKAIKAKENEMLKPVEEAERRIKGKTTEFLTKKFKEQREKEKKLQDQANQEGIKVKVKVETSPAPTGQISKEYWFAEVFDKALVPEKYKIVNQSALNQVAAAEKKDASIPGVEIKMEVRTQVRG